MLNELSNRPKVKVSASPDASSGGAFRFKTMSKKKNEGQWFYPGQDLPTDGRTVFVILARPLENTGHSCWFDPAVGWMSGTKRIPTGWRVVKWMECPIEPPF